MQNQFKLKYLLSLIAVFAAIPCTIFFGMYVLGDRKYYFISLFIIILSMIPFFLRFEHRKPKSRELILISVMSAIAVIGRTAFFMLPQVKPAAAIIIITGACFGAEAGFLTGAMTAFVSNFFFGQGPYTPWQMFCFGMVGFFAGVLFHTWKAKKSRLGVCLYGGWSTLILYGGIINFGALLMNVPKFTSTDLAAWYLTAGWFDFTHAISTVIFLYLIANPMIEKLERIKIKYGFME